jgi:hypothetical protein
LNYSHILGIIVPKIGTIIIMIEYDSNQNPLKIIIPVSGIDEVYRYQKGVLTILSKIEIDNCKPSFKEDLKAVYELLSHLLLNKEFFLQYQAHSISRSKETKSREP